MRCVPGWIGGVCVNAHLSVGQSSQLLKWLIHQRYAKAAYLEHARTAVLCNHLMGETADSFTKRKSAQVMNPTTVRPSLILWLIFGVLCNSSVCCTGLATLKNSVARFYKHGNCWEDYPPRLWFDASPPPPVQVPSCEHLMRQQCLLMQQLILKLAAR